MLNLTFWFPEFFANVNPSRQDMVDRILSGKKPAQTSTNPTDVLWLSQYVLLQQEHWRYIMATSKSTSNKILQIIVLSQKLWSKCFDCVKRWFIALFYAIAGNWEFWVTFVWRTNVFSLEVYLSSVLVPSVLSLHSKYFSFPPLSSDHMHSERSPVKTQWSQRSALNVFSGSLVGIW